MQSDLRKHQLAFVNQQARFDFLVAHGVENLVERHGDGFDVGLEELQRQIGSGERAGNGDFAALEVVFLDRMRRDHDRAVALAEARAAIEQQVLVGDKCVAVEADRRDVVGLVARRVVQRLDVAEDVIELHARQADFARGQGIKHEGIVTVGRMSKLDGASWMPRLVWAFS